MKKYKVLFADLDGTLIETLSGNTFPQGIWDMRFKLKVLDQIRKLQPKYLFIVTNQGGIERGLVDRNMFDIKSDYICYAIREFLLSGRDKETPLVVACIYCATNTPNDGDRKPNTGMLYKIQHRFCLLSDNIQKEDCLMIGDASGKEGQFSDTDKRTAENYGIDYLDVEDFLYKK